MLWFWKLIFLRAPLHGLLRSRCPAVRFQTCVSLQRLQSRLKCTISFLHPTEVSPSSLLWALLGPVLTSHTLSPSYGLRVSLLTFPGLHVCCPFGRCSVNPCWINRLLARSRAELFCRFSLGSLAMSGPSIGLLKLILIEGRGKKKNPGLSNHLNHYLYCIRHFWFPSCISDRVPECM